VLVADLRQFAGLVVGCRGQDAGFGCWALEADGAVCVRALFESQQVRFSRSDERGEFLRWCADGGVVQAGGGGGESAGRQRADQGAVDEQGAVGAALHAPSITRRCNRERRRTPSGSRA
jgi:hypothetical protein